MQLNDEQYWLYAAVDLETNELPHAALESITNTVICQAFFADIDEKPRVGDASSLLTRLETL